MDGEKAPKEIWAVTRPHALHPALFSSKRKAKAHASSVLDGYVGTLYGPYKLPPQSGPNLDEIAHDMDEPPRRK